MTDTYREILQKIENSRRFGNRPGVETTAVMLEKLGQPQQGLPFIHVAGTNGKGSVCAFLTSILRKAGKRTGCFTSPHLIDFEERITVDGVQIPKEAVERLGRQLLSVDFGVTPTMFDYCLLMAILYFKEQRCDIAVIETGLGGRLDSTNALGKPLACVITHIGYDHMEVLGDTLQKIAAEKAGILKQGVPAVFAPQEKEALAVLQQHKADAVCVTPEDCEAIAALHPRMDAKYQRENAAAAAAAANIVLAALPRKKREWTIVEGIKDAVWEGRMELLSPAPFLLVDGAHNADGVRALRESLTERYPGEKFHFVMGVMADKDYEAMAEQLFPLASDFVTVTPESARALQAKELASYIKGRGIPARAQETAALFSLLPEHEKTVAFGSLYFIGELKKRWRERYGVSGS